MKEFSFTATEQEFELIYKALLELPGKYTIALLVKLDNQLSKQIKEMLNEEQLKIQFEEEIKHVKPD